jgi:hypothetical protein
MADVKISGLPASTTPLAGTEVLPVVQSGVTKKVASDDLTVKNLRSNATTGILQVTGPAAAATRVMTAPDANFSVARIDAAQSFTGDQTLSTGNLVIGTSGKGIDFSATAGTGTSELLADYEEGTWTPVLGGSGGTSGQTYGFRSAKYTKVGNQVTCAILIQLTAKGTITGNLQLQGLPFAVSGYIGCSAGYLFKWTSATGTSIIFSANSGDSVALFWATNLSGLSGTVLTSTAIVDDSQIAVSFSYLTT